MALSPVEMQDSARADYIRALEWLFGFANYEVLPAIAYEAAKFNLDRIRGLLDALGNPQEKFQSVHIAGTKGKGSTAAICESILRAAGYKTGLYTSPHLHTFRERIVAGGALIPPEAVAEGVDRLKEIQPRFPELSVFELMTALAFDYFARAEVQTAVVEVGIGGRLDATNVITPRVSVLTSISYDHTTVLGDTISKIAVEKAGIIKPGVPVVSAPQEEEALAVFERIANKQKAPLTLVGRDWKWELVAQNLVEQDFRVTGQVPPASAPREPNRDQIASDAASFSYDLRLHLLGAHQLTNATTAVAAVQVMAEAVIPVGSDAICTGVANARWPGRFEVLDRAPYLVVDGAHNRDSARQLVATINALLPGERVQWIFGASSDKDITGMFDELLTKSTELILTRSKHPRSADSHDLATLAQERGIVPVVAGNVAEALDLARWRANGTGAIVVTGSLFVVAEARAVTLRARGGFVESDDWGE